MRLAGRYRVERSLGRGGGGEVHLAYDEVLERRVAVKLVTGPGGEAADRERILREARAVSGLSHPGIVTVHEVAQDGSDAFIVMEYVAGETLAERLARTGPLAPGEAVGLVAQVADALEAAHAQGILHRDVKCANLMIDAAGRVRVLDFGICKRLTDGDGEAPRAP
jgi:serine/threonine-protein kinase